MRVGKQISDAEMQQVIKSKQPQYKDAAYAAVDRLIQARGAEIYKKEGLRSELVEVCAIQVARYEELAKEWINYAGGLDYTHEGKTFKQNFIDGVYVAVQSHLANRLYRL